MGNTFTIGGQRAGWKSEPDTWGHQLMVCGRAVTLGEGGRRSITIHLSPQDRVQAAEALLHNLRSVAEPPQAVAPVRGVVILGALLPVTTVFGALVGAWISG